MTLDNPIREYYKQIKSGKIVANKKIKDTFFKLNNDLKLKKKYFYSEKHAQHAIDFIEFYCRHSKGKLAGQKVKLELFEKAIIAAIFGFLDHNGNRKYQKAVVIVAKKNGKSFLSSAIGLYLLVADNEGGPEVYSVATKKDQAKIIWAEAKKMVGKSPALRKRIKRLVNELSTDFNDGTFKPLASDADTLDGLNVHGVLMDEIHQWKNGISLYNIMVDGTVARSQPLTFITSTAGFVREDLYDTIYEDAERQINSYKDKDIYEDEHSIYFIYELDKKEEWTDEKCWIKANPGLGTIKNIKNLRAKVLDAVATKDIKKKKNLLCKEFNIRETSITAWLDFEDVDNREKFSWEELKPKYVIGCADLSRTTDLTSAKVIFKVKNSNKIYVESMYWIPEEKVETRVKVDKLPYDKWIEQGYCRTCAGNSIDPQDVTKWFLEISREKKVVFYKFGVDGWSAKMWVTEIEQNFGKNVVNLVPQLKKVLSDPMQKLEVEFKAKNIIYQNNPMDKMCFCNTSYDQDKNGNIQPVKDLKATRRIDGLASLLDGYVVLLDFTLEYSNMI